MCGKGTTIVTCRLLDHGGRRKPESRKAVPVDGLTLILTVLVVVSNAPGVFRGHFFRFFPVIHVHLIRTRRIRSWCLQWRCHAPGITAVFPKSMGGALNAGGFGVLRTWRTSPNCHSFYP